MLPAFSRNSRTEPAGDSQAECESESYSDSHSKSLGEATEISPCAASSSVNSCDSVGFLIVGHGTRNLAGQDQLRALVAQMQQIPGPHGLLGQSVELGFLELAEPNIEVAVERLAARGVRELVVVPVLLFTAGHARQDIPQAVEAAAERFQIRVIRQCSSLCLDPAIVELSAERFQQSLAPLGTIDSQSVALALIGRGSSSDAATSAMLQFTEQRVQATRVGWYSTGFIHAQRPTVDEALDGLAATGLPWLVVQPHLLFEGELVEDLRREIAYRQSYSKSQRWLITGTLGANISSDASNSDTRLAAALCKLARTALVPSSVDTSNSSLVSGCSRCGLHSNWCSSVSSQVPQSPASLTQSPV